MWFVIHFKPVQHLKIYLYTNMLATLCRSACIHRPAARMCIYLCLQLLWNQWNKWHVWSQWNVIPLSRPPVDGLQKLLCELIMNHNQYSAHSLSLTELLCFGPVSKMRTAGYVCVWKRFFRGHGRCTVHVPLPLPGSWVTSVALGLLLCG